MNRPRVALVGALDTKGPEYGFAADVIREHGVDCLLIDVGVLGTPAIAPDIGATEVASAGGTDLDAIRARADRSMAMQAMAAGAAEIVERLQEDGSLSGLLILGGSNAAYTMSVVAERLPVGFPKLLVSTMAAGDTSRYVGQTDLTLMYPVVDINGLNRVSRAVIRNAAAALVGMARGGSAPPEGSSPVAAISMMGVTTTAALAVTERLENAGVETLSFHATGAGGRAMESLIRSGLISGVADLTTSELADELVGGICSAGPDRVTAAGRAGIPQIVSLGGLDMVIFGPRESVPGEFQQRTLHEHNPQITLLRTDANECAELGRRLAERLNLATGPTAVIIPEGGFSQISVVGGPFHDPEADAALIDALVSNLHPGTEVHRLDADINDPAVSTLAADKLIDRMQEGRP